MAKEASEVQILKKAATKGLFDLFERYQSEIKKIKWGSRQEVWAKAKLVIVSSIVLGFLIYATDLAIRIAIDLCRTFFMWAGPWS